MTIPSGTKLGRYEIRSKIGAGGMGEVYLAEDTKLDRQVALKVLLDEVAGDEDRVRRFVREAKAASALNHPNILTVYEIGETDDGTHYIATELIDGKSLREHIAHGESLPLDTILKIGAQVAEALSAAHHAGIIHRDIKPENIMIRKDGYLKVLDFGLAKLSESPPETSSTEDPTRLQVKTTPGMIMGTVSYMSPEQMRGKETDARTDLWSLGVVLYEMLTRISPFEGETKSDTFAAVLTKEPPPLAQFVPNAPAELQRIVRKALAKDRDERYQTARDLMTDLKTLRRNPEMSGGLERLTVPLASGTSGLPTNENEPTRVFDTASTGQIAKKLTSTKDEKYQTLTVEIERLKSRYRTGIIAALGILLIGSLAYFGYLYLKPKRLNAAVNNFQSIKLDVLTAHGLARSVAISPDGKYIAYAKDEDGKQSLWLRQTASAGDTQIVPPGQTKYDFLRFSGDGNFLYFVGSEGVGQSSSLYQITTLGRNQRKLITGVDSQISFSPDGTHIAFIRVSEGDNSIVISAEQGGDERILVTRKYPKVYGDEVSWSPDGKLIAAPTLTRGATYAGGMAVVDVATGNETPIPLKEEKLLRISQLAWMNDGKGLIYTPYAADMGQRYQIRYAAYPSGDVQNVTNDLSSYEDFSLTADSQTMVAIQRQYSMGIWLTLEDEFSSSVSINSKTAADDGERGISWTKDGKIVFVSSEGGAQNIWRMDADGSNPKPLTTDYKVGKLLPTLSIGGDSITYFSRAVDPATKELITGNTFFQMDSAGQNVRRVVESNDCAFAAASANADWVVYTSRADGMLRIWKAPLKGGDAVKLTDVDSISPTLSRDGKLVAYFIREKGKPLKLGIISIAGGDPLRTFELPVTTNSEAGIAWNKTGDGILFVNTLGTTSNIFVQPLNGAKPTSLTAFKEFQIAAFALNPEGNRLAVARGSRNRDIVVIKNIRK